MATLGVSDDLGLPRLDPFHGSNAYMFSHTTRKAEESPEPPLAYPGATPDAERAQRPPLPEPPYRPYARKAVPPEPPYRPYSKKPATPELPYEPYKDI